MVIFSIAMLNYQRVSFIDIYSGFMIELINHKGIIFRHIPISMLCIYIYIIIYIYTYVWMYVMVDGRSRFGNLPVCELEKKCTFVDVLPMKEQVFFIAMWDYQRVYGIVVSKGRRLSIKYIKSLGPLNMDLGIRRWVHNISSGSFFPSFSSGC